MEKFGFETVFKMRAVRVFGCVLALFASLSLSIKSTQENLKSITFLTNYVFIGRHAPFFVGKEKGFYREAGFDINILPATGSAFVITALEGRQADYGMVEAASLVQAIAQGASVKAFGVYMDQSTSGLASLAPYPTLESLTGRTVAASLTDSARVILPSVLAEGQLNESTIDWLTADPSVYFSLLLSGRADLVTAASDSDVPTLQRIVEPRGRTVHFSSFADWGYDVYGYFLVARSDRLRLRQEEVRAFATATATAVDYAVTHPEEAARIMARYSPALDEVTALAHWKGSISAMNTAAVQHAGYGIATQERLQRSIDFVGRAFEFKTQVTPNDLYAHGFLP